MEPALNLGAKGEEAVRHLLDVYSLSTAFEPCLVLSRHREALAEVRRRLAAATPRLLVLEPADGLAACLDDRIAPQQVAGLRPIVWVEPSRFLEAAWRRFLRDLAWRREELLATAPWMWIFAGPPELILFLQDEAPHLLSGVAVQVDLPERPRLVTGAPPGGPVRVLHISDLHFAGDQRWDRRSTLRAFLEAVKRHREKEGLAPGFVVVSGDIAQSGKEAEYEQAQRFFEELAKVLALAPAESFFLVPGNHDVDRDRIGPADGLITANLSDSDTIEEVLRHPRTLQLLGSRLEAFYAFTARLLGPARAWQPDRPWRADVREVDGTRVGILQLNSSWISGPDDAGGLLVGAAQVREALSETADCSVRVAVMHHSLHDLRAADRAGLEGLLDGGEIHLLLRGHLHRPQAAATQTPDGLLLEVAAGALYDPDSDFPRRYLLTELDLGSGTGRVHFFRFSPESGGFWARDPATYRGAPAGVWEVALPRALDLSTLGSAALRAGVLPEQSRLAVAARYRAAAAAVHGVVRFAGFAARGPRPSMRVPELFVPLRMERCSVRASEARLGQPISGPPGESVGTPFPISGSLVEPRLASDEVAEPGQVAVWDTPRLLRHLLGTAGLGQAPRIAVLGAPGSGKTTLCQFAAVVAAGESKLAGVQVDEDVLPLFLPVRDYLGAGREARDCDLLTYLGDQARSQLQIPLPEGFLGAAAQAGRAVLLLDGLDEVGSPEEREVFRDRVAAFCRLYPRVPVLVTSRVAGYDQAPLPDRPGSGFLHLALVPFEDSDLEAFARNWYAVQEPERLARAERTADLLAAIRGSEPVRELARNPLLATLIALVHRFEAYLPGNRARLYELCVKTLLETWPAARRRRFHEIDEGLQQAYLEALAFRIQERREREGQGLLISRDDLIATLTAIVVEHSGSGGPVEAIPRRVERWLDYLEEGTGLLVEQQPQVLGFLHLSLMEYLAACGWEKAERRDFAAAIAQKSVRALWKETCLLAVGRHATDKGLLDRLVEAAEGLGAVPSTAPFLFDCLLEEAAFDDRQREAVCRAIGRILLDRGALQLAPDIETRFDRLYRLSRRHRDWAQRWWRREVSSARGDELLEALALRFTEQGDAVQGLEARKDPGEAAVSLLEAWPLPVGVWAVKRARGPDILEWGRQAAGELAVPRALAALAPAGEGEVPAEGIVVSLLSSAIEIAELGACAVARLASRERPGGWGVPAAMEVGSAELLVSGRPRSIHPPGTVSPGRLATSPGRYFGLAFWRDVLSAQPTSSTAVGRTSRLARDLSSALAAAKELVDRLVRRERQESVSFAGYFARDFARDLGAVDRCFSPLLIAGLAPRQPLGIESWREASGVSFPAPAAAAAWVDLAARDREAAAKGWGEAAVDRARGETLEEIESEGLQDTAAVVLRSMGEHGGAWVEWQQLFLARCFGESWIAFLSTPDAEPERGAYVHRRVQHAWLLHRWPSVERLAGSSPLLPAPLALYLALGWTQATTTWQWPGTDRWRQEFSGPPPAHWLPRSQWHLCRLLAEPENLRLRAQVAAALREGGADPDYPGLSVALRNALRFPAASD